MMPACKRRRCDANSADANPQSTSQTATTVLQFSVPTVQLFCSPTDVNSFELSFSSYPIYATTLVEVLQKYIAMENRDETCITMNVNKEMELCIVSFTCTKSIPQYTLKNLHNKTLLDAITIIERATKPNTIEARINAAKGIADLTFVYNDIDKPIIDKLELTLRKYAVLHKRITMNDPQPGESRYTIPFSNCDFESQELLRKLHDAKLEQAITYIAKATAPNTIKTTISGNQINLTFSHFAADEPIIAEMKNTFLIYVELENTLNPSSRLSMQTNITYYPGRQLETFSFYNATPQQISCLSYLNEMKVEEALIAVTNLATNSPSSPVSQQNSFSDMTFGLRFLPPSNVPEPAFIPDDIPEDAPTPSNMRAPSLMPSTPAPWQMFFAALVRAVPQPGTLLPAQKIGPHMEQPKPSTNHSV
jgi:hypothetical protein